MGGQDSVNSKMSPLSMSPNSAAAKHRLVYSTGVPISFGQPLDGVNKAPDALRKAGLPDVIRGLNLLYHDAGDFQFTSNSNSSSSNSNSNSNSSSSNNYHQAPDFLVTNGQLKQHQQELENESGSILQLPDLRPTTINNTINITTTAGSTATTTYNGTSTDTAAAAAAPANINPYYLDSEIINSELIGRACYKIASSVYQATKSGHFSLTIGGDHSIAAGSIAGSLLAHPDLIVVWVDAHGDANTPETSPSKHYHGMPVAHLLGWFRKQAAGFEWLRKVPLLAENSLAFIGLRDLDAQERELIKNSDVVAFTMHDVDRYGIAAVVEKAMNKMDPGNKRKIHLSFDIDSCDPSIAPGTGTKSRGGLTYREAHYICEYLAATGRVVSMDMVEINPEIDIAESEVLHGDQLAIKPEATKTVRLGIELIASTLGKVIL